MFDLGASLLLLFLSREHRTFEHLIDESCLDLGCTLSLDTMEVSMHSLCLPPIASETIHQRVARIHGLTKLFACLK